jgi:methylglyoxal synthase
MNEKEHTAQRITLALIAHDGKKDEMVHLAKEHKDNLAKLSLVATRSTGQLVRQDTGLHNSGQQRTHGR